MLDRVADRIERYMDLLSARQRVVASNIANAATPGYKAKDIDFQSEFHSQLGTSPPNVVEARDLKTRNDGNNVDIDREARLLAENAIRFNLASQLLRSQIKAVKAAIQEGRNP